MGNPELQLADEIQEPAVVLIIQIRQVITEVGEIVTDTDFQVIVDMTIDTQQGTLAVVIGLIHPASSIQAARPSVC